METNDKAEAILEVQLFVSTCPTCFWDWLGILFVILVNVRIVFQGEERLKGETLWPGRFLSKETLQRPLLCQVPRAIGL